MIATVVGSYPKIPNRPRPARLRNAIARFDRGEIGEAELRQGEDAGGRPAPPGPPPPPRLSLDQQYRSVEGAATAIAEALNHEAKALQAAGAMFIQFNEPALLKHKEDFPLFRNVCRRLIDGLAVETAGH